MGKPVSLFSRILIVILGFGLIAGFIFGMAAMEDRIAAEIELKQLEIKNKNSYIQKQTKVVIT